MLLKLGLRHASRVSFKLPPIKFKYGQQPPSAESTPVITTITTPVITTPVAPEKSKHHENKRTERKEKPQQTHKIKPGNPTNLHNLLRFKSENRSRFTARPSRSVEENLMRLGINVSGEVIYGIYPVLLALQAKRRTFHHLVHKDVSKPLSENLHNILSIAREQGIPVTTLKPQQFNKIFPGDQVHQGVCCDVSPLPFVPLEEEWLGMNSEGEMHQEGRSYHLWLYLDQIRDPMNFGAVLRSAYFMGVGRVIASASCSARITSTVSKASAGVAELFPVHQVEDPVKLARSLTHGGWVVASSASPASGDNNTTLTDVTSFNPNSSILLIVGNEGNGVSPELQQICHTALTIQPGRNLHPHLHCLNVSVATALLLHSLSQRLSPHSP
ncbi:rRNA methyltransferase 1, mitochondrial [Portunus trituberculatus]|uniref:rRNA methyltransferase 1, mitochondrial n=1 Tax=Portunus trituberculatus TaxID=210409 RepID=A0A5B7ET18_PORTR|nr:rRNA methyltransferase 1, mitochondrial [Portunus trituberculatus]